MFGANRTEKLREIGMTVLVGMLLISVSAGLIMFNKFLITKGRFPYAVALVSFHVAVSSVLSTTMYLVRPSLFPSLTDETKRVPINKDLFLKGLGPISIFFVGQLVLSNTAYLYSSVSFLQMMKESNLVLVYLFSLLAAMEVFKWRSIGILIAVIIATSMTITGEIHFSAAGCALQGTSQLFESLKIVLVGLLLSSATKKLDPFSYVMLMTPVCFLCLMSLITFLHFHPIEFMQLPAWLDIVTWLPYILANAVMAFSLNLLSALFIKLSSPVAFILAGIVKDASVVVGGALFMREALSAQQITGFAGQLIAIGVWMAVKTFPDYFEDGLMNGFYLVISQQAPRAKDKSDEKYYGATSGDAKC